MTSSSHALRSRPKRRRRRQPLRSTRKGLLQKAGAQAGTEEVARTSRKWRRSTRTEQRFLSPSKLWRPSRKAQEYSSRAGRATGETRGGTAALSKRSTSAASPMRSSGRNSTTGARRSTRGWKSASSCRLHTASPASRLRHSREQRLGTRAPLLSNGRGSSSRLASGHGASNTRRSHGARWTLSGKTVSSRSP